MIRGWLSHVARVIPIESGPTALAAAAVALEREEYLIWFPEGTRSLDGKLQPFRPGIGVLLRQFPVAAIPVLVDGVYEALPPQRRWPRFGRQIRISIGQPYRLEDLLHTVAATPADSASPGDKAASAGDKADENAAPIDPEMIAETLRRLYHFDESS